MRELINKKLDKTRTWGEQDTSVILEIFAELQKMHVLISGIRMDANMLNEQASLYFRTRKVSAVTNFPNSHFLVLCKHSA